MGRFLLLFTVVPLVELFLLMQVGSMIGVGPTIALVLLTGIVGGWLARSEGTRVFRRWQRALDAGRMPEEGVLDGLLVLVGGVLLVTPGVLTDVLGLALMIPPSRRVIGAFVRRWTEHKIARGDVQVFTYTRSSGPTRGGPTRPSAPSGHAGPSFGGGPARGRRDVIDAEGEEID